MRNRNRDTLAVITLVAVAACGGGGDGGADEATEMLDTLAIPATLEGTAPESFQARFETSKGDFVIEVHRDWAPNGADRFYNLVRGGYFDGVRFFRVVDGFMAQFGVHGTPAVARALSGLSIPDDSVTQSNTRGRVTFAAAGPGTRTTQIFISFGDNSYLDDFAGAPFAPFGEVVEGMGVVDQIYSGYGDMPSMGGDGPDPGRIQAEGNAYLDADFPMLDHVVRATLVGG